MSLTEKFRNLALAIRQNGGLWRSVQAMYRIDDVKDGTLVGVDRNGNRYYENKRYFIGNHLNNSSTTSFILLNLKEEADGLFTTKSMAWTTTALK